MRRCLFKEFLAEMDDENQKKANAKNLFANHTDQDGLIGLPSFKEIAKYLNITLNESELEEDFNAIDEDEDKKIGFEGK